MRQRCNVWWVAWRAAQKNHHVARAWRWTPGDHAFARPGEARAAHGRWRSRGQLAAAAPRRQRRRVRVANAHAVIALLRAVIASLRAAMHHSARSCIILCIIAHAHAHATCHRGEGRGDEDVE